MAREFAARLHGAGTFGSEEGSRLVLNYMSNYR